MSSMPCNEPCASTSGIEHWRALASQQAFVMKAQSGFLVGLSGAGAQRGGAE